MISHKRWLLGKEKDIWAPVPSRAGMPQIDWQYIAVKLGYLGINDCFYDLYINSTLSCADIAYFIEINIGYPVCKVSVQKKFKEVFDITFSTASRIEVTAFLLGKDPADYLREIYQEQKSTRKTAEIIGTNFKSVSNKLKEYGIPMMPRGGYHHTGGRRKK